jgi:putative polyhydroxyalkanoate system protein
MSDIKYVRTHSLPLAQAKAIAQKTADDLAQEYDLRSEWEGDTLHFHRSGVQGHMAVSTEEIALDVKLGFLLRPFKAKFEQHIERHLDQLLAAAPAHSKVAKAPAKSATKPARTAPKAAGKTAGKTAGAARSRKA